MSKSHPIGDLILGFETFPLFRTIKKSIRLQIFMWSINFSTLYSSATTSSASLSSSNIGFFISLICPKPISIRSCKLHGGVCLFILCIILHYSLRKPPQPLSFAVPFLCQFGQLIWFMHRLILFKIASKECVQDNVTSHKTQ